MTGIFWQITGAFMQSQHRIGGSVSPLDYLMGVILRNVQCWARYDIGNSLFLSASTNAVFFEVVKNTHLNRE